MKRLRKFSYVNYGVSTLLLASLVMEIFGFSLISNILSPTRVDAAVVTIDSTVSGTDRSNNHAGAQTVFVSDTTGYVFYRDANGSCSYSKSIDSGDTWAAAVTVDAQTDCIRIVVWYDQWTLGDSGSVIHIATADTGTDSLYYNSLDTSTDTLSLGSAPVNTTSNSGQTPTFSVGVNTHTITKATDGEIYLASNDNGDSYAVSCSATCGTGTNWNEVGVSPYDNRNDHNLLVPLSAGNIMAINRDLSANVLRYKIWNGIAWSASWTTIASNAGESVEYDAGMSATVDLNTGYVYLAYVTDNSSLDDDDDDIRTAVYDGSAWTLMADVLTNEMGRGIIDVAIGIDQNNSDVYVAYTIQDTGGVDTTASIYYKESTDGMTSWGVEEGPVNSTPGDIRKPALDPGNYDRLYVSWWENSVSDRFGETLDNIGPDSTMFASGTQADSLRSGTTDNYLGGLFVLNSLNSNSVSSITLTETGTIDASTGLSNIKLFYDLDTSAPYDCSSESYSGGESQFGATDTDGFSSANGTSTFSGGVVGVGPTQAICVYVVSDVTVAAGDTSTIEIEIANPPTDVIVTGSDMAPATTVSIDGLTTVVSPGLTQTHYHWRIDDGSEAGATSATAGVEDTPLNALSVGVTRRLRVGVSVEGSTSTNPVDYQLQFSEAAPTCEAVTSWTNVDAVDDAFNMQSTANLIDGGDTTNIANGIGGITDENVVFLSPNGGVQDTGDSTGAIVLETNEFLELEFSLVASTSAIEGNTYCFRLSDAGDDIGIYDVFPSATINSEITVASYGTQITDVDIPSVDTYVGGGFSIVDNATGFTVSEITLTETGTIDASTGLSNIKLFYDLDTSAPYDCSSESYSGGESQFGATDTDGFSSANGTSTFSGGVAITSTQTLCVYPVLDVTSLANNGETLQLSINSAKDDVVAAGASVSPSTPLAILGDTTLLGPIVTQTHYHWRNDDGSETTATSLTGGSQDVAVADFQIDTPVRLRLGLSNEGATSSAESVYVLEYGTKITTCSDVALWTAVDATDDDEWDVFDSANLTHGNNTTNIPIIDGGLSDENSVFYTPNAAIRDTDTISASTTLQENEYTEYEFSITSTVATTFDEDYCFRLSTNGMDLAAYDTYAELSTASKRDFKTQRGTTVIDDTTETIVAGVDYTAPAAANTAFIRITTSHHTGAGNNIGGGGQDVEETTAYIQNPGNLDTSITFARDSTINQTHIDWEIIEFIAQPDTDNEMIVRSVDTVSFGIGNTVRTGSTVTVDDDSDVVVFVTGVSGDDGGNDFFATQITAEWDAVNDQPVFTRGATGGSSADVSYAVVEYTGLNWSVQRVEHTYVAAGAAEVEAITPVPSMSQAFIHAQKRMGDADRVASLGQEVYLSSIGQVSFELAADADMAVSHVGVAWVIENTQTGTGAMKVERQSGDSRGIAEPLTLVTPISSTLDAVNNSSVFANSSADGTNTAHPRSNASFKITSPTTYEIWRSDTGTRVYYRSEIVQWPVADLVIRQNYYRFYVDNNQLTPVDPWPEGAEDLGENTSITDADDPPGIGDVLRLRTTLRAKNANWPADFYAFKLQYAERVSTCTAVGVWTDVGQAGSGEIWRGFSATGTVDGTDLSGDPPTPGDLLMSVADVAGALVHQNQSATNTYIAYDGEDVEYDWYLEHNGASPDTFYCFRVVESNGTDLSGYLQYPQLQTADFTPEITNWRWYDDVLNETPSTPLAALNAAPTEIATGDTLALRVVVDEQKSVTGDEVKFKLQFSEDITFANPVDVAPSSTCSFADNWCYVDGGGADNATITTAVTGLSDGCVAGVGVGCGTHNASATYAPGHDHDALSAQEYSFTIQSSKLRSSAVYYFRLYDVASARAVDLFSTASYPAAVGESARLIFSIEGLPAATTTAGITTDITTEATAVNFGILPVSTEVIGAQRLNIDTNAVEGYQVWKFAGQLLTNGSGANIDNITSTNAAPSGWLTSCPALVTSCVGYHSTDGTLSGGSSRFAATDTYAALHTSLEEIMYSSLPSDESHDVVYRIRVNEDQPPGDYTTNITYIASPIF